MQIMGIRFQRIDENERKNMEADLFETVVGKFRKDMIEEGYYRYEVEIQFIHFKTDMTDQELKETVKLTIDLLEELKNINNEGLDKENFEDLLAEAKRPENEKLWPLWMWNQVRTNSIDRIVQEIDDVRRVGGAWSMLIANPQLETATLAVYQRIVDVFDDTELYETCAWFLLRSIMRMHSDPLSKEV